MPELELGIKLDAVDRVFTRSVHVDCLQSAQHLVSVCFVLVMESVPNKLKTSLFLSLALSLVFPKGLRMTCMDRRPPPATSEA